MSIYIFEADFSDRHKKIVNLLARFKPHELTTDEVGNEIFLSTLDNCENIIVAHDSDVDTYCSSLNEFSKANLVLHTKSWDFPKRFSQEKNIFKVGSALVEVNILKFINAIINNEDNVFYKLLGKNPLIKPKIELQKKILTLNYQGKNFSAIKAVISDDFTNIFSNLSIDTIESTDDLVKAVNEDVKSILLEPKP